MKRNEMVSRIRKFTWTRSSTWILDTKIFSDLMIVMYVFVHRISLKERTRDVGIKKVGHDHETVCFRRVILISFSKSDHIQHWWTNEKFIVEVHEKADVIVQARSRSITLTAYLYSRGMSINTNPLHVQFHVHRRPFSLQCQIYVCVCVSNNFKYRNLRIQKKRNFWFT